MKFSFALSAVFLACGLSAAYADPSDAEIDQWLSQFDADAKTMMNQKPSKKDASGVQLQSRARFDAADINTREYITIRDKLRAKMFPTAPSNGRAPIASGDEVHVLVDGGDSALTDIYAIEKKKIRKAQLKNSPWSDSYWPLYQGTTAARYADDNFPSDWKTANSYAMKKKTALKIFESQNASSIDTLSPAEKYDLLTGNLDFTFTKANWEDGKYYMDTQGEVESWMGICHGWAAASYMLGRPEKMITLTAADGETKINFYPSDIKALSSLLWAEGNVPSKFAGYRCNVKDPEQDSNGRITNQECFDTNPGTFFLSMVNQIGISKRSVVIDATFDYEVWNQPVLGYSYKFFNPKTKKTRTKLEDAMIEISEFSNDKFADYRSEDAAYVVGVAMDVTYMVETNASHEETDSQDADESTTATYMFDLEIDANGNVIGGEWYQNMHPDFLWTPAKTARAVSPYDKNLRGKLNPEKAISATWQKAAAKSSVNQLPLATIVEKMILEATISQ